MIAVQRIDIAFCAALLLELLSHHFLSHGSVMKLDGN